MKESRKQAGVRKERSKQGGRKYGTYGSKAEFGRKDGRKVE